MASGVNVKMGVSGVAQFKQGLKESQAAVKNLDQQLKLNEAQFKATGDAEIYMQNKSKMLEEQIEKQREVVKQSQAALEAMQKNGVDQSSVAFQKMQQQVYKAATDLFNMQAQLNNVAESGEDAGDGVDAMNQQLKHIGEGVDTKRVIDGINGITGRLEAAAKAAWNMGKQLINATLGAGSWADDLATRAKYYGLSTTELQQMEKTAQLIDTPVDAILNAQKKLKTGLGKADEGVMGAFVALLGEGYDVRGKGWETAFWDAGEALMQFTDAEEQEVYAQKLFGRSWNELIPLFEAGKKQYDEMNESWNVVSEDNIQKLTDMDDEYQKLSGEFETFKMTVLATMADVLTPVMETLTDLMEKFNEYLSSPEGKEMLKALGDAVSGLFADLATIDPESVVSGLVDVFGEITKGFQWLIEHREDVVTALKFIVAGWAGLKLAGGALEILNLINGAKGLLGGGAAAAETAGSASTAGGAVAKSAFWTKAAGGVGTALESAAFAAPFVLFFDGLARDMSLLNEMREKGAHELQEYAEDVDRYSGSDMFNEWKTLKDYMSLGGASVGEDNATMKSFAEQYMDWLQNDTNNPQFDRMADLMTQDEWEAFNNSMRDLVNNTQFYSDEERDLFLDPIKRAIELIESDMETQTKKDNVTSEDIQNLNNLPSEVRQAVKEGMASVTIVIDDRGVSALGSRIGRDMWKNTVTLK